MGIEIRKMTAADVEPALEILGRWNMRPREGDPEAEREAGIRDFLDGVLRDVAPRLAMLEFR